MDEQAWEEAEVANEFNQHFPYDTSKSVVSTEVRMTYDDDYIYVLDTYKNKTNAFVFGVNPYGVQREGLVSNGGNRTRTSGNNNSSGTFLLTWDNKWYSEAKIYDDYWIAEMAIPFKTLRFKENIDSWYINFYRIDSEYAERSSWSPIPRNLSVLNLASNKELKWDEPLKNPGKIFHLYPRHFLDHFYSVQ